MVVVVCGALALLVLAHRGNTPSPLPQATPTPPASHGTSAACPSNPAAPKIVTDLGTLTDFYRATQLQGHLRGAGLMKIPDYLTAPDIDVTYRKKPGFAEEVPFVDSFAITRFLGGYREDWLKQSGLWDSRSGSGSLDYAVRGSDGTIAYRPDLIGWRLQPYLDAGYRLGDITLVLSNVPWGIARGGGEAGVWGQRNPPASMSEWDALLTHFAQDLKRFSPNESPAGFKIGSEYDTAASWNGSAQDYFDLYSESYRILHPQFPASQIVPGEMTGDGLCDAHRDGCVYDTRSLLDFARSVQATPPYLPRSLHSFQDKPSSLLPAQAVQRAVDSYRRLGSIDAEIHQFGLLDQPFGSAGGEDQGGKQAAWEFETLLGLKETLNPSRVFHWDTFSSVPGTDLAFLNGSGFLRLFLDRYRGAELYRLPAETTCIPNDEVDAAGFKLSDTQTAIMLADFRSSPDDAPDDVTLRVPAAWLAKRRPADWKFIRFTQTDNVFAEMRRDLDADHNLKPEFQGCPDCLANPLAMAADPLRARRMLATRWPHYQETMKAGLRFQPIGNLGVFDQGADTLRVRLSKNELLILE